VPKYFPGLVLITDPLPAIGVSLIVNLLGREFTDWSFSRPQYSYSLLLQSTLTDLTLPLPTCIGAIPNMELNISNTASLVLVKLSSLDMLTYYEEPESSSILSYLITPRTVTPLPLPQRTAFSS
jgi:hypothetical protein